jgi:hypothetical protein
MFPLGYVTSFKNDDILEECSGISRYQRKEHDDLAAERYGEKSIALPYVGRRRIVAGIGHGSNSEGRHKGTLNTMRARVSRTRAIVSIGPTVGPTSRPYSAFTSNNINCLIIV